MKQAEAEALVRSVVRVCRGPRRKTIEPRDYERLNVELQDALAICAKPADGTEDVVGHYISELLFNSLKKQAGDLDDFSRQGCGADFNNIVLANPLDGRVRKYECPSCHLTGIYQAPVFEIEEGE